MKLRRNAAVVYALLLSVFTGYVALDTFVLPHTAQLNAGEANLSLCRLGDYSRKQLR